MIWLATQDKKAGPLIVIPYATEEVARRAASVLLADGFLLRCALYTDKNGMPDQLIEELRGGKEEKRDGE